MNSLPIVFILMLSAYCVAELNCPNEPCENCEDAVLLKDGCYSCVCEQHVIDDMHLTDDQWKHVQGWIEGIPVDSRAGSALKARWPKSDDGKVNIETYLSPETADLPRHVKAIIRAMNILNARTCLRLGVTTNNSNYILFIKGNGCWSQVGMIPGGQAISIGSGCGSLGVVEHEIYHALGFYHEQSRPDRGNYVKIIRKNIQEAAKFNFYKESEGAIDSFGSPYDKQSVMHYGGYDFSKNGNPTIIDKETGEAFESQRVAVSEADLYQLNEMYSCNGNTGVPLTTDCYHHQDYGTSYRGFVTTSESGLTCQHWNESTPNPNQFSPDIITGAGLSENYCRNPDGFDKPWCYVVSDEIVWEYCDIPECSNDSLFMVLPPLPVESTRLYWSAWSEWTPCNPTCRNGQQHRTRACAVTNTSLCVGDWLEARNCKGCDGAWGNFNIWSSCSVPCGVGKKFRVRRCDGGECKGRVLKKKTCKVQDCPLYPGGDCVDKNDVNSYRGNISVANNGHNCKPWSETKYAGSPLVEENFCRNPNNRTKAWPWCFSAVDNRKKACDVPQCPETPVWGNFTEWSSCSKPCGGGTKYRTRKCINGEVTQGGCIGKVIVKMACNVQDCDATQPTINFPQTTNGIGCVDLNSISSYRGQAATTLDGQTCQHWDAQTPHNHSYNTIEHIENLGLVENYCRVFSEDDIFPYCLVVADSVLFAYCDIPVCKPEPEVVPPIGCRTPGEPYMGGMNITRNGYTCQRWDVNNPHYHSSFKPHYEDMRALGIGPHNYCRDPVSDGPWCYTTDPHFRYDYCDVPFC